jgi:syndecan 1
MTTDGADRSFGAPRFDVVLRGYDRRQVDEHLSRLQRVLSRMRGDLDTARTQAVPPGPPTGPFTPPGVRPRPTPRPRPDMSPAREAPDVVGTFTDRMQTILQAAEDEAAEIKAKARSAVRSEEERLATARATARAEEEMARVNLANLLRQRDAVLADLTRVRGQLEALLSGPTARIVVPTQDSTAARRDAGAGHPLPGTPGEAAAADPEATVLAARPVEPSDPAPSSPTPPDPVAADTPSTGGSGAQATAAVETPGNARPPAAGTADPNAPVPAVAAAEQTMVMAPARPPEADASSGDAGRPSEDEATDPPTAADIGRADDTVEVDAVGRPAESGGAADGPAEGDPDLPRNERDRVSNSR